MNQDTERILKKLHEIFQSSQMSLSVAESCTGGLISNYITSIPGASSFFTAGIVSYSQYAKENILKVPSEIINTFGVISEETAKEMAEQVRIIAGSDYAIATTGNLGPDALEGKSIGLIYIAVSKRGKTATKQLHLSGGREAIKEQAAQSAFNLLLNFMVTNE